jgi:RND family efflux transporter MFP subunit
MRYKTMAITLIPGAAILLSGCRNDAPIAFSAQAQAAQKPVAVETTTPQRKDVWRRITLPGDVVPVQEATLYAKVPGYLDQIYVDKGDRVKAGQVLAVIRAPEIAMDKQQAQNSFLSASQGAEMGISMSRRAEEELKRSKTNSEKSKLDYAQSSISVAKAKAQLRQAQGALQKADALKDQAQASLEESNAQVEKSSADLESARADQKLAEITYDRYKGVAQRDVRLIAAQQVDEAESKAKAAAAKTASASSQLSAARLRVKGAQAQLNASSQQIEQERANIAAAEQTVAWAESQVGISHKQMEAAGSDVQIAIRQRDALRSQAQQSRFQADAQRSASAKYSAMADYMRIVAPFDGVVTRRFADAGAFIQTAATSQNAQPIVTVANIRSIRIYLHIPELEASFVMTGSPVELSTAVMKDETIKVAVKRTSGVLDPKTRTLLAEVDMPNTTNILPPGSYVVAKVGLERHSGVISLPNPAIGSEKSGKFLFINQGGKAKRIPITVGFNDGSKTEVTDGVRGDEEVVVTGRDNLSPGTPLSTSKWAPKPKK